MNIDVKVCLDAQREYPIFIEPGILSRCGEIIRSLGAANRVAVVTDSNVEKLHLSPVMQSLAAAGFTAYSFAFAAGEPNKNLNTVESMLAFFCEKQLTRHDLVLALGGGVCGDLAGFAAAIYLRGIDFIQLPTTLLAQVDSSVGGKTGCDLPFGKNLCGAFHLPRAVLADPKVLRTLSPHYLRDGMAEVIKAGAILRPALFELLEQHRFSDLNSILPTVLAESIAMKVEVTERDFTEKGDRMLLNFGHTLGHAIEKYQQFCGLSHGQAVSVGMVLVTRATERAGLTAPGTLQRLCDCLTQYGLPLTTDIPPAKLCEISQNDKKAVGNDVQLVYLKQLGQAAVKRLSFPALQQLLEQGMSHAN